MFTIKPASELRSTSRNEYAIKAIVREVLLSIQVAMVTSNKEGLSRIRFPLPKQYSTVGTDPDSILMITVSVLRQLLAGGYDVKIRDIGHSYEFDIRWLTEMTERDRQSMTDLLKKYAAPEDAADDE